VVRISFPKGNAAIPLPVVPHDSPLLCGLAALLNLILTLDCEKPHPRSISRLRCGIAGATSETGPAASRVAASNPCTRLNR
jgi:hypothetical protein